MASREAWDVAEAYEYFMGRWSRRIAVGFVRWLDAPARLRWLDVGCGTGALTAAVLAEAKPAEVVGVDPSEGFVTHARDQLGGSCAQFEVGDARSLPFPDARFDVVVSGLVLNFVPEPTLAAAELARVATPGGIVAAYVWDYADDMAMLQHFWEAATALDPDAAEQAAGRRFPLCRPEPLRDLWTGAGLAGVVVKPIEVPMMFRDFDDFWAPFLGGQGSAPGYVSTLDDERRTALRDLLRERLPVTADGSIILPAHALAVRGAR
jgi:SAM-dependent methyltransferase